MELNSLLFAWDDRIHLQLIPHTKLTLLVMFALPAVAEISLCTEVTAQFVLRILLQAMFCVDVLKS
jgi:hypothetical protein